MKETVMIVSGIVILIVGGILFVVPISTLCHCKGLLVPFFLASPQWALANFLFVSGIVVIYLGLKRSKNDSQR